MRIDRRTILAGLGAGALAGTAAAQVAVRRPDGLLAFPATPSDQVDFRRWIDRPVILRSAEMLKVDREHEFVRVVSEDGVEGVVKANSRMAEVSSLFHLVVEPRLVGQDMRDIERLIRELYTREYKFASLPFWTAVGHLELAIWDMMGRTAGVRCVDFMGPVQRTEIPIYISSLRRNTRPEEEVAWLAAEVETTGARGVKIKVGGRMSRNIDASPGRSEAVVRAVRRHFGDDFTIYADANGSYDAPAAIELCRMLEDHGVAMLEEPCPFEDVEMTRQVVERTQVMIAGGEQDNSLERWRWLIENRGLDVLQPDFMYNGGMARTLEVQRMAAAAGIGVAPHYPRSGSETVELIHFAAYAPNLHGLQEYRGQGRDLDFAHEPRIAPRNGVVTLPEGPGFGVTFDPELWPSAERL
jgi:L-alanine-DL-glutamate epimerase-like enolase superfamily enzyme